MERNGSNGCTIFVNVCLSGQVEIVRWMVEECGADVEHLDAHGRSPFCIACFAGQLEVAR